MLNFTVITLFPDMFTSLLDHSILKKAQEKNLIAVGLVDLRDYTTLERRIRATPPVNSFIDATARGSGPYFYRLKIEE